METHAAWARPAGWGRAPSRFAHVSGRGARVVGGDRIHTSAHHALAVVADVWKMLGHLALDRFELGAGLGCTLCCPVLVAAAAGLGGADGGNNVRVVLCKVKAAVQLAVRDAKPSVPATQAFPPKCLQLLRGRLGRR